MNWYKRAQYSPAMGALGPAKQTTGLFGHDEIGEREPDHKNNINLHLNRANRELSSALQEPDIVMTRQRLRKALRHISRAQRRIDFV
jgi:hypothetical protein